MTLFRVDPDRCRRDGFCAAECPLKIVNFANDGSEPVPAEDAEELCIACGHCVAVCPHGAFSHRAMTSEDCPPVSPEWPLSPQAVEALFRSRRSTRAFKEGPVEPFLVEKLIEHAAYAPSGHNRQPVQWLVISGREKVQVLAGLAVDWMESLVADASPLASLLHMSRTVARWKEGEDLICRRAPCLVVAHAAKEERTAPVACTIALTYLELGAASYGLGACWAGYVNTAANLWAPLLAALDLPAGHLPFGAMMLGYPKHTFLRIPKRKTPSIRWR